MNMLFVQRHQRLLPWLAFLLLATLVGYRQVAAQLAAPTAELVAGSYSGTVLVSEPALLGDLDLLLEITSVNGQITGKVNPIKTQVFLGGPTFTGKITTSGVVTPTVHIESQPFSGEISGRTVQRRFLLTGEVLANGDRLRGTYTETIVGFKPHPLLVKGTFLLVRPSGVTEIITVPAPRGTPPATPTTPGTGGSPTPTALPTVPPINGDGAKFYLPLVQRAAVNAAVLQANIVNDAPTLTPSATPTPTVTEMLTLIITETPTPASLALAPGMVLTTTDALTTTEVLTAANALTTTDTLTTTEVLTAADVLTTGVQQQIHLPLIMH